MTAYGLKRGAVPALRMLAVYGLSFILAYAFKDPFYPMLHKLLRKMDPRVVESLSYLILQVVAFAALLAVALKYGHETIPVHKALDRLGGVVFGAAAGLALSGMLVVIILSIPGGRRVVGGGYDWYFCPQQYALRAFAYLSKQSMAGERAFNPSQEARDLIYGVPVMPRGEDGLWVTSIPLGLRVYVSGAGESSEDATTWKKFLEPKLLKTQQPARRSEHRRRKRIEGYIGRTPVFAPVDEDRPMVAVEMPLPKDLSAETGSPFVWDGEIGWWAQDVHGEKVVVKVYRLERKKDQKPLTLVAAFLPKGPEGLEMFKKWLPGRPGLADTFDAAAEQEKIAAMSSSEAAEEYVNWLKRGGKAVFESPAANETVVLSVTSDKAVVEKQTKPATYQAPLLN